MILKYLELKFGTELNKIKFNKELIQILISFYGVRQTDLKFI